MTTATTPLFQWDDAYLIGIDELDYEHRGLIDNLNELHEELLRNVDRDRVDQTLGDIHARLTAHFALEERVMRDGKYAGYATHKREHDEFLDDYVDFLFLFENNPGLGYSVMIETYLKDWVVNHILTSDRKMSQMIRH
ncbi:MAG: hemerythrin family protein [Hyphomicrobiales bacterium]|nr:hemerythrin family protein [Hyphomicrobiales bacterium]